ncbi:type II secretion system protein GspD [Prochlorococcus marinus]|uniref:type II secretion system protein GspD n=1 Tax=Prochlorococcus marinus TaxID=1219 RepID=UPI0039A4AD1C
MTFIAIFVPLSASAKFSNNSINLNYKANLGSSKKIKLTQKDLINNQIVSVDLSNDNEKRNNISSGNNIIDTEIDKNELKLSEISKFNSADQQKINLESIDPPNDSIIEDLKEEINQTIYKSNSKDSNDKTFKSESNKNLNKTPPSGKIFVGGFTIPPRGYVNLEGPKITLNLVEANVLETLKFLAKTGDYGFLYINNKSSENDSITINEDKDLNDPKVTVNFVNQDFSQVFNSLLMASNLQAKFEKGIIFVGENIFNKSLVPKFSKTYRINQASAASVGDYLSTLGAKISKVLVKGNAIAGDELGSSNSSVVELTENYINSYGMVGGPLSGLIGTVDLRLQTITLVGEKNLIATAEKYIKSLDVMHRQVALSVQIIDVSLEKSDLTENKFEARSGGTYIINNGGFDISVANDSSFAVPPINGPISSFIGAGSSLSNNNFINWLSRKITNDNAKIIASPTLILGENQDPILSGAAEVDDGLSKASIGRPFANEAFIKVGESVVTSFETNVSDGVTTCTAFKGIAGITFGAKLNKIDDNGFVTFSLSPAISSITKTETVANCGTQSTLSVRRLDTGVIRVKDGNTLVISGVLKDEDAINTKKTPLLGDLPLLGSLFRNNTTVKRKSELIILVTPKVLNEKD